MGKQFALHIDSNRKRQSHICRGLELLGFVPHKAPSTPAAREKTRKLCYHLVLMHLDTVGKEIAGFCTFIRSGNPSGIIIVTMNEPRIRIEERLFDCGVNDVVTGKQASTRVLKKRIRAHLITNKSVWPLTNIIRLKDTVVDFDRREVWCNGSIRRLPGILADLLKYFVTHPNRIISRDELLESYIWADSICSSAKEGGKTFDVNVGKLRKIVEPDPIHPEIIQSVRGVGWKMARNVIVSDESREV